MAGGGGELVLEVGGAPPAATAERRTVVTGTVKKTTATRRPKTSIYHVPAWIRDLNSAAYTPRFVSFGPYHHGVADLRQMEKRKRTVRSRFLVRASKSLDDIKGTVDDLMDSYENLDKQWRDDRDAFLDLMVLDGCFRFEVLLHFHDPGNVNPAAPNTTGANGNGYAEDNPVFGKKGAYMMPYIRRDMLLIENQLPLLLLERLALALPAGAAPFSLPHSMITSSLDADKEHDRFDQVDAARGMLSHYDGRLMERELSCVLSAKVALACLFVCSMRVPPLYIIYRFFRRFHFNIHTGLVQEQYYCNVHDMVLRFLAGGKLLLESGPLQMALPSPSLAELLYLVLTIYGRLLTDVLQIFSPVGRFCLNFQRLIPSFCLPTHSRSHESAKKQVSVREGIHILDVYKKSMLLHGDSCGGQVPFSSKQLSYFGVKMRAAHTGSFRGVDFNRGRLETEFPFFLPIPAPRHHLRLPVLKVDDDTLPTFLNLAAFERLHHDTGNEVNNYLLLMCSLVRSVEDVDTLHRRGIIVFGPGHSDGTVCKIFGELAQKSLPTAVDDAVASGRKGGLYAEVAAYCRTPGARTIRWFRLCKPPPFLEMLLSLLAISVSLFIAVSNQVFRFKKG